MTEPRDGSYVWVTWITALLAGDDHCDWKAWFKAHYSYTKRKDAFDFSAWNAQHAQLVRAREDELRAQGYEVRVEAQNGFRLVGKVTTLGGKPDLVATKDGIALVVDCKTGIPRASDRFQVLSYMFVLPYVRRELAEMTLNGELCYQNGERIALSREDLTSEVRGLISAAIERAGGVSAPRRVPGYHECRYCDIGSEDCPERVENEPPPTLADHGLF